MSKMETEAAEAADIAQAPTRAENQTGIQAESQARNQKRRKRLFIVFGSVLVKTGIAWGAFQYLHAAHFISTDNAYTAAETAQVTPAVGGIVREVRVADTQQVAQAEAELGRALRRVRGYVANDGSLAAQITALASDEQRALAQVASATADLERSQVDLARREALASSGSISGDELTRARNAHATATANLTAAQAQLAQARANTGSASGARQANAVLIADTSEADKPEVALARARRDQALVNLERTVVRAPVDGVVAKRSVQLGQQVQAGTPLLSVVPLAQVHVDAYFKEGQLERVRIGQPVELRSDLYGDAVVYHGVVAGLSAGTGATFATIPAQNATGNWIKVVQRVPVRVALDPAELAARPLQVGLSMTASIDTRGCQPPSSRSPAPCCGWPPSCWHRPISSPCST